MFAALKARKVEQDVAALSTSLASATSSPLYVAVDDDTARVALTPMDGLLCYERSTSTLWQWVGDSSGAWVPGVMFGQANLVVRSETTGGEGATLDARRGPLTLSAGTPGLPGAVRTYGKRASLQASYNLAPSPPGGSRWDPAVAVHHVMADDAGEHVFKGVKVPDDPDVVEEHLVVNRGANAIRFLYDAGGAAAEGVLFRGDGYLRQFETAFLFYDNVVSRWRAIFPVAHAWSQTDDTGARVLGTTYQAGVGLDVHVAVTAGGVQGGVLRLFTSPTDDPIVPGGGTVLMLAKVTHAAAGTASGHAVVPPGHFYMAEWAPLGGDPAGTLSSWVETTR